METAACAPFSLWLVRHARPLIAPGICYGRHDVAADAAGTRAAAERLHAALPPRLAGPSRRRCEDARNWRRICRRSGPICF